VSDARQLHDSALGELANGRPAAAVAALKKALALDANEVAIHNDLGIALQELMRFDEAEAAFRDALRIDPSHAQAQRNLGELLQNRGKLEEARQCFESVLSHARGPISTDIYMRLGAIRWQLGDTAGALGAFEHSVAAAPGLAEAEAHYNLGCAQLESGRLEDAVRSAREAIRLRAGFTDALILCAAGLAATGAPETGADVLRQLSGPEVALAQRYLMIALRLMSSKLFAPARACLERVLRADSGEVMARHLLAALSGANPEHPVDGYVRQLFDASAASFDRELVSKLGYAIPREMVVAVRNVADAPGRPWEVLDLGCGTGLVGVEIAPDSRNLIGFDLAPNMIEHARARNIYTGLRCVELLAGLSEDAASGRRYDIVTAADVFIYVGRLDAVIPAIHRVLRSGGLFAFSAEALEPMDGGDLEGYRLGVMGRYAHSAAYLRRLAAANGFDITLLRSTCIRSEHRRPVQGWLTVWRAV